MSVLTESFPSSGSETVPSSPSLICEDPEGLPILNDVTLSPIQRSPTPESMDMTLDDLDNLLPLDDPQLLSSWNEWNKETNNNSINNNNGAQDIQSSVPRNQLMTIAKEVTKHVNFDAKTAKPTQQGNGNGPPVKFPPEAFNNGCVPTLTIQMPCTCPSSCGGEHIVKISLDCKKKTSKVIHCKSSPKSKARTTKPKSAKKPRTNKPTDGTGKLKSEAKPKTGSTKSKPPRPPKSKAKSTISPSIPTSVIPTNPENPANQANPPVENTVKAEGTNESALCQKFGIKKECKVKLFTLTRPLTKTPNNIVPIMLPTPTIIDCEDMHDCIQLNCSGNTNIIE